MGTDDTIESLRENRIYQDNGELVYDYAPLFKRSFGPRGVTIELLDEEIYRLMEDVDPQLKTGTEEDKALCELIQNSQEDPRENIYFGHDLEKADYNLTVLHLGKSKKYPIQLLPKYYGYLKWKVKNYSLTQIEETISEEKTGLDKPQSHTNLDELQEGTIGLLKGARKWDRDKGPTTPYLKKSIAWELGHAFEQLSTDQLEDMRLAHEQYEFPDFKNDGVPDRVLIETMDSYKGGSLNELNEEGEEFRTKNLLASGQTPMEAALDEEKKVLDRIALDEFNKADPNTYKELLTLMEKRGHGEQLDQNERQRLSRSMKKAKNSLK